VAGRLDKATQFLKSNYEEQDETACARLGAKVLHQILSGQFHSEDIDLLNQVCQDEAASRKADTDTKRKLVRIFTLFANNVAFIDEKFSSQLALRFDFPVSILAMERSRCQA
jgi:hypothetical protein